MQRQDRTRQHQPCSGVPWPLDGEPDVVAVDTTWGILQPLHAAPGSHGGRTIPGSGRIPHDQIANRQGELDRERLSILFCNGPQCPQTWHAVESLLEAGYPARALAYYRGGMHDWVTLAMPTESLAG